MEIKKFSEFIFENTDFRTIEEREALEDFYGLPYEEILRRERLVKEEEEIERFNKTTFIDKYIEEIRIVSSLFSKIGDNNDNLIQSLIKRLRCLENPTSVSKKLSKIEEVQFNLMVSYLLKEFKESSNSERSSVKGYNFESFIAGLVEGFRIIRKEQSPVDIIDKGENIKLQLKYYTHFESVKANEVPKDIESPQKFSHISIVKKTSNGIAIASGGKLSKEIIDKLKSDKDIEKEIEDLKKSKIELLERCTHYIIALKGNNDVKIFIIPTNELIIEFEKKFYSDVVYILSPIEKYKKIIDKYKNKYSNDSFLIGNGLVISKSRLVKRKELGSIEYFNFKFNEIEDNANIIDKYFAKYISEFKNKIEILDNNYKKMIFGKSEGSVSKNYKDNFEETNKALNDVRNHVNNSSYGKIRNDLKMIPFKIKKET
jgi:hypothetical protein